MPARAGAGTQLAAVRDFSSPRRCTHRYCGGLRRPLFIYPPDVIQPGPRCRRFVGQFYFSAKFILYVKGQKIDSQHPFGSQDPVVPTKLGEIRSLYPRPALGRAYPAPTLYPT
jgi:hypothetical protein